MHKIKYVNIYMQYLKSKKNLIKLKFTCIRALYFCAANKITLNHSSL